MSSALAPAGQARSLVTPVKQTPTPVRESPGNWKHPRLAEITQRQSKTSFGEKNIRQIVYNIGALVLVGVLRGVLLPFLPSLVQSADPKENGSWISSLLSLIPSLLFLIPLTNIGLALLPLVRPADDLSDIPLTPSQRKLLGLPPSAKAATPNSGFSTPPKYTRTPSIGGSPASLRSHMSSPLASPASDRRVNNSPYSPSPASPLLHKAIGGGGRRSSFGTQSPLGASLGASTSSMFGDGPATPTPATGKRSSVSLNNKWLYEKGRRASGNSFFNQSIGS